jgi:RimJ/RimL family protein N-acetyltransferase
MTRPLNSSHRLVNGLLAILPAHWRMAVSYSQRAGIAFATPITTPRLIIRSLGDGDEKAMADFLNADGGSFPRRYHHYIYDPLGPFDEQRVRNEVFPAMKNQQQRSALFELYVYNQASKRIVGMIEFTRDQLYRHRVSYFILPSERRHGYAFEAYAACINQAVDRGFLSGELYAHTDPDNTVSQKFLEKAGFQNLGKVTTQNKQRENITVVAFSRGLSKEKPIGQR